MLGQEGGLAFLAFLEFQNMPVLSVLVKTHSTLLAKNTSSEPVNIYVSCETSEGLFSLTKGKRNPEGGIKPKAAFKSIWRTKPLLTGSSA